MGIGNSAEIGQLIQDGREKILRMLEEGCNTAVLIDEVEALIVAAWEGGAEEAETWRDL